MECDSSLLVGLYRSMVRIRVCEESLVEPILKREIRTPCPFIQGRKLLQQGSVLHWIGETISSVITGHTVIFWPRAGTWGKWLRRFSVVTPGAPMAEEGRCILSILQTA
jgi:hypothetical protein